MYDPKNSDEKTLVTDNIHVSHSAKKEDAFVMIYPTGPNMGRQYTLKGSNASIGRDPSNDIVVDNDSVSRRHARLTVEAGQRLITDLQSTNGSYVNNKPILTHFLQNGDQVKIGDTIFKYIIGSDVESAYHEEIYQMTIKDGLTGIYNKRFFLDALDKEISRAQRYDRDLSMLMLDLDHFKNINDTYGHLAGDYVLQVVARLISTRARREEVFCRYGGEEFAILLPETANAGALKLAEQIRKLVGSHTFIFEGEEINLTVSIGVSATLSGDLSVDEFIKMADAQLYKAKLDGRNCVHG
ncbi:MAG: GGDEF domain-containing protein [Proteobacteria bacterium]|nr:GGDEF domain-containing protein [Pseudomonadota bacterium]